MTDEKTLKEQANEAVMGKAESTKKEIGQSVEIKKDDFQGLLATIQQLQSEVSNLKKESGVQDLQEVKERTAKIHLYKDKVVTKTGIAWEEDDKYGEPFMRLEIFCDDKKYEVDYKKYNSGDDSGVLTIEEAVIKEVVIVDDGIETQGYTDLVEVDYENYRSISKGRVPVRVVTPKQMYIMKRSNGEEVEINPNALN